MNGCVLQGSPRISPWHSSVTGPPGYEIFLKKQTVKSVNVTVINYTKGYRNYVSKLIKIFKFFRIQSDRIHVAGRILNFSAN